MAIERQQEGPSLCALGLDCISVSLQGPGRHVCTTALSGAHWVSQRYFSLMCIYNDLEIKSMIEKRKREPLSCVCRGV